MHYPPIKWCFVNKKQTAYTNVLRSQGIHVESVSGDEGTRYRNRQLQESELC